MQFAATWLDVESIILSEVIQEKDREWFPSYMGYKET